MSKSMVHFLLVFDHEAEELVTVKEFGDPITAADAYAAEERSHQDTQNIEIVLVGADSMDTIRLTHGQYFAEVPAFGKYLSLS